MTEKDYTGKYGWLTTGSGNIEILAPIDEILAVTQSGDNSQAVGDIMMNPFVEVQLERYSDTLIFDEYDALGVEHDFIVDIGEAKNTLIWALCWDFLDGGRLEDEDNIATKEEAVRLAFLLDLVQTFIEYDTDCQYEYEVLKYDSLKGIDVVYFGEYLDEKDLKAKEDFELDIDDREDLYELTIPAITELLEQGKAKLLYKEFPKKLYYEFDEYDEDEDEFDEE